MGADDRWHARVGAVLTQCLRAGFRYGPAAAQWRGPALVVGASWKPVPTIKGRARRPDKAVERKLGSDPSAWPSPAAACSPFVGIVLRLLYDLRAGWGDIGKSIGKSIRRPGLAEHVRDAHPRGRRAWDLDHLPDPLPGALCLVVYRSHVVLLVDCGRVPVIWDGVLLRGLWIVGADGGFDDTAGVNGLITRRYSCRPLTCETAGARAARQRSYPDRRRVFRLVGLAAPARLPEGVPILTVE